MGKILCQNIKDPDAPWCLGVADARYTMDFSDVEPGSKVYWCAACGPKEKALEKAIMGAFETRSGFEEEFQEALDRVERKH